MREAKNINPNVYSIDRAELWIMMAIALITFTAYCLTLSPGVTPGESAMAMGQALNLLPGQQATSPTFLALAKVFAKLPCFGLPVRLNLFSALCGCFSAAILFRIAKRFFFELIRDTPSIRLVPVNDDQDDEATAPAGAQMTVDLTEDDSKELMIASVGGVVAALTFAFSTPFWIASTSLHTQPLLIIGFLLICDCLAFYHFAGSTAACICAALLLGAGMIESPVFIFLLPVALVVIVRDSTRFDHVSESFFMLLLLSGLVGFAINGMLFLFQSNALQTLSNGGIGVLLSQLASNHLIHIKPALPPVEWLFVLLQTVIPFFLTLICLHIYAPLTDEITRWKWGVTNLLISISTVACLLNAPHTVWSVYRNSAVLPVFSFLLLSITTGALSIYWLRLLLTHAPTLADEQKNHSEGLLRTLSGAMCMTLFIVVMRTPYTNSAEANSRKTGLADELANVILSQNTHAKCLLTDKKTLDLNLLIRSHLSGRKLNILPAESAFAHSAKNTKTAQSPFSASRASKDAQPPCDCYADLENWLRRNPSESIHVATVGQSPLWNRSNLTSIPNGIVMSGSEKKEDINGGELLARNLREWEKINLLINGDYTTRPELTVIKAQMQQVLSRTANDLGVLLESMRDATNADSAYLSALRYDPQNKVAEFNHLMLCALHSASNAAPSLAVMIARVNADGFLETLENEMAHHGSLSLQTSDTLLPAILAAQDLWGQQPEKLLRLAQTWTASHVQPQPAEIKALALCKECRGSEAARDEKLAQAIAVLREGNVTQAEKFLRLILMRSPDNLSAMGILAEILLQRGEVAEVKRRIAPAMMALTQTTNNVLTEMTIGSLAARVSPPDYTEAHRSFEKAFSLSPEVSVIGDELLKADLLVGDADTLEQDARRVLDHHPEHALANAVLGNLSLSRKQYPEAEAHLKQSIKTKASYAALNDLADLMAKTDRFAEAEQMARQAINLNPMQPLAWGTFGEILDARGRSEEAERAVKCAILLQAATPAPYLLLAHLWLNSDKLEEAKTALDKMENKVDRIPDPIRTEVVSLRNKIGLREKQRLQTADVRN